YYKNLTRDQYADFKSKMENIQFTISAESNYLHKPIGGIFMTNRMCVVYQTVDEIPLREFLKKDNVNTLVKFSLMRDVAKALEELHNNNMICGNLKVGNVLITRGEDEDGNETFKAKLVDYGDTRSVMWATQNLVRAYDVFSPKYIPPETLIQRTYTQKSDMYSFGMLLVQVLISTKYFKPDEDDIGYPEEEVRDDHGCVLIPQNILPWVVTKAVIGGNKPVFEMRKNFKLQELVSKCCAMNPNDRVTASTAATEMESILADEVEKDKKNV
ncbi:hypothetical protein EIN_431990, partial [Entamoeba invadens IP1]